MFAEKAQGWRRHILTFLMILAVGGLLVVQARSCRPPAAQNLRPKDARLVEVKISRWRVQAEVADTEELRRKGLSGRSALEQGGGMLFVFEQPQVVNFWMKDTSIPLSIAFIKEDGTIVQMEDMQPNDLTVLSSVEPVKYALEVRQGWFQDRRLTAGTKAELPAEIPPPRAAENVKT